MSILKGIRVLDCSIAMAGPFAAQRMGDMGADVIKVEPVTGEWQRHASAGGARGNRINVSFLSLNRNKRSLSVDLKTDEGRAVLMEAVKTADVFLQNYRPGVAKRLGVDYETLASVNPRLIYVSMSGYGEDGPYAMRPGQDLILQGMSGAMKSTGRAGEPPTAAGQYLVDAITAYSAFEGALAALFHRERTGEGQKVEVNMLDAITTLQMQELTVFTKGGIAQTRSQEPHAHVYIRAPYGAFQTADGYIILAFPPLDQLGGSSATSACRSSTPNSTASAIATRSSASPARRCWRGLRPNGWISSTRPGSGPGRSMAIRIWSTIRRSPITAPSSNTITRPKVTSRRRAFRSAFPGPPARCAGARRSMASIPARSWPNWALTRRASHS